MILDADMLLSSVEFCRKSAFVRFNGSTGVACVVLLQDGSTAFLVGGTKFPEGLFLEFLVFLRAVVPANMRYYWSTV